MKRIKIVIYGMLVTLMVFVSSFAVKADEIIVDTETDFIDNVIANIDYISSGYEEETGEEWNTGGVNRYIPVYDIDDEIYGYIIIFENGYVTISLDYEILDYSIESDQLLFDETIRTYFIGGSYFYKDGNGNYVANSESYVSSLNDVDFVTSVVANSIYYCLSNYASNSRFSIDRSYASNLATSRGTYGSYTIVTGNQLVNYSDCGCQAALNLIYTYDFTNNTNIAQSLNWDTEINNMRNSMNWTPSGQNICGINFAGVFPSTLVSGFRSYTNDAHRLISSATNYGIRIGLYSNLNATNTAHYALYIGTGKVTTWGIFKTYYDIIATWYQNFYTDDDGNIIGIDSSYTSNYYVVRRSYALWYYRMS